MIPLNVLTDVMTRCNDSYMETNELIATDAANDARQTMDIAYLSALASRPVLSGLYQPAEEVVHAHTYLCRDDCPF